MQIQGVAQIHSAQSINSPHRVDAARPNPPSSEAAAADQLDISPEANLVSQARDLPEIRSERVAEIRAQIESGKYETDEKIDAALERLLDEIG